MTPEQEALSDDSKIRAFWESRARSGDPYAERALEILEHEGLGAAANLWLSLKSVAAGKVVTEKEVNLRIMRAHVERLKIDDDGLLRLQEFTEYHHDEFEKLGLPASTFAGTPFFWRIVGGGNHWPDLV